MKILYSNKINLIISTFFFTVIVINCACPPPNQNPNQNRSNTQSFVCAVVVRDRDKNSPVGQVSVSIIVSNETIQVKPTDDNGQARFVIDEKYLGNDARIYAESSKYHPKDDIMKLRNDETKILQIVSKEFPITIETPVPPPTNNPSGNKSSKPTPTVSVPTISLGEIKNGKIADGERIDYRFEGNDNAAILFKIATAPSEKYYSFEFAIYDAEGFLKKRDDINSNNQREMPFTPKQNGIYTLRLLGKKHYGDYTISMQPMK